ncbi:F-box/LRR-repeat protein 13-like [Neltuma alba]|uniref:F-box/LRR-repeat protein 13-like n=1 Tax=Neltuma alba TaxID=207710 RepID=UPI0010A33D44|nr:F-box/LRR-repeat protein 13-like [Prosopis alba]
MEESVSTKKTLRTEVEVRDRISDLPDSLLLHILSFLPAKEAVATSLLSKRWRPLWPCLPTLDLKRQDFQRLRFFHRFVDRMLKLADLKSVRKFVLWLDYYDHHEYFRPWKISKWINIAVVSNKIEHLELRLNPDKGHFELPSGIFTNNNIKVLKLSVWSLLSTSGVTVGTLSHVNLPLLEVLHLADVEFADFRSLGMLLSACPLLKHLVVRFSHVTNYCPLDIGRLNHLVTAEVPESLLPLKVFANATFLYFHWV